MPLDKKTQDALKQYGTLGELVHSVPELGTLWGKALAGKWSNDEFARNLQDSKWWKSNQDSVKQNLILKTTKPGEWKAKQGELINKARLLAAELGVSLGEGSKSNLSRVVNSAMSLGWDEARLRQAIGGYWQFQRGKEAGGTAGQITQKLRAQYASYGVKYSPDSVANATKRILTGKATIESYQAQALQAAKGKYLGFAAQLDQGLTMHDIAEPYKQSMAALLELPADRIDLYDPTMQKALTAKNAAGHPEAMPLWQFETNLRKDPRRDKTKGAVNEAYDTLRTIKEGWGF